MARVFGFHAVTYAPESGVTDLSGRVSPPYDVLDDRDCAKLRAGDPHNIVSIDLPHTPPKTLGPPEAYAGAGELYRNWLTDGTFVRSGGPVMFAYRQTFDFGNETFARTGMACTIPTAPFGKAEGGGILPHEETFSGPKEDRFALMKATRSQMSPIFGLHADESGRATRVLTQITSSRKPDMTAKTADGVVHDCWRVADTEVLDAYRDALTGDDIFIADGHHRYNTALNYLKYLKSNGPVSKEHPARRCMAVLVGMSDPGLVIGPTHRILGGMSHYQSDAFLIEVGKVMNVQQTSGDLHDLERLINAEPDTKIVLGLHDFASGKCFVAHPKSADPLGAQFPDRSTAWRTLDVAVVQHTIVESVCQPSFNNGEPVQWAFPHTIDEVIEIGKGVEKGSGGGKSFVPQLGVIVRPTPMRAVRDVSNAGELMPQKSTFFYPKLATGLFVNPLD